MKKVLVGLFALCLALTGCGGSNSGDGLKTFRTYELQASEVDGFNYLTTNKSNTIQVTQQLVEGLVEYTPSGELVGAQAQDGWKVNDDATVWTFTLKDGLKWVDQEGNEVADVTAHDFVSGIKYNLTYEVGSPNVEMITSFIKGAEEYYEASEAGTATDELFDSTVGVKALDDKTIEYTLSASKPYFNSVVTYCSYMPVNEDFLKEQGDQFGIGPENILYNGCYLIAKYEQNAYKEFKKNDSYWDKDNVTFDTVTVNMVESQAKAYDMFKADELDYVALSQDAVQTELAVDDGKYLVDSGEGGMVYSIWFNFEKTNDDNWNKAVANENFRKAWFYGIDATEYNKRTNSVDPDCLVSNTYTYGSLVQTTDGTPYSKLEELKEYSGDGVVRYNQEKADEYKAKAMEELKAQGVTFPIQVNLAYNSGNQTSEETYAVQKQSFEATLGTDFIEIVGIPYIKSVYSELYAKGEHSIAIIGWGADYADPFNFLYQLSSLDGSFVNTSYSHVNDATFDKMVDEANDINDIDERYHAFAAAEAYALDHAYVVPLRTSGHEVTMTKVNNYSKPKSFSGRSSKMKYWQTQSEAYTKEEYAELAKADN